jgi:hypothetical protein
MIKFDNMYTEATEEGTTARATDNRTYVELLILVCTMEHSHYKKEIINCSLFTSILLI